MFDKLDDGESSKHPSLAYVFSGGGARGFAHIGILKVLHQAGIKPDLICGASMGGVIGAAYAKGLSPHEIERKALVLSNIRDLLKLIDIVPPRKGILQGEKVREYLVSIFNEDMKYDDLRIPLILNSVDLHSGEEICLSEGLLLPAIMSTIAVPGLFSPVEIKPYLLVDGGVLNNLPINHARTHGIDFVIAVDVQSNPKVKSTWSTDPSRQLFPFSVPDFFQEYYLAQLIMVSEMTDRNLSVFPANILIRPEIPPDIDMFLGFPRAKEAIEAGYIAANNALPEIIRLLHY